MLTVLVIIAIILVAIVTLPLPGFDRLLIGFLLLPRLPLFFRERLLSGTRLELPRPLIFISDALTLCTGQTVEAPGSVVLLLLSAEMTLDQIGDSVGSFTVIPSGKPIGFAKADFAVPQGRQLLDRPVAALGWLSIPKVLVSYSLVLALDLFHPATLYQRGASERHVSPAGNRASTEISLRLSESAGSSYLRIFPVQYDIPAPS